MSKYSNLKYQDSISESDTGSESGSESGSDIDYDRSLKLIMKILQIDYDDLDHEEDNSNLIIEEILNQNLNNIVKIVNIYMKFGNYDILNNLFENGFSISQLQHLHNNMSSLKKSAEQYIIETNDVKNGKLIENLLIDLNKKFDKNKNKYTIKRSR